MTETAKMQLTDWLDDLSVRFIVNLPREELESVERICFQVEEAQWFYEDFVRPLNPNLPSLSLRQFSMKIFQHCPLFSSYGADVHSKAFAEFLAYKTRVPVRGAILLNEALDQVILVKGWKKGSNWSFPRGKINKDERDIDCAVREVYEETGFDVRAAGLAANDESARFIEVTMREQHMKLFVFAGVPMSTHFEPRTRKEISKIQWYKLSELPTLKRAKQQQQGSPDVNNSNNKFYMVAPFLNPLRKIINAIKKEKASIYEQAQMAEQSSTTGDATVADSLPPGNIVSGDLQRLMNQLRQSQQASRETNFPEVSLPPDNSDSQMASAKLRKMLSLVPGDPPIPETLHEDVPRRESKANAMLSILWGLNQSKEFVQEPTKSTQIPFERMSEQPNNSTHSPNQPPQVARPALAFNSQFPQLTFPPPTAAPQISTAPTMHFGTDNSPASRLSNEPARLRKSTAASTGPANTQVMIGNAALPTRAPYQQTGDPSRAYESYPFQDIPAVPPASRLPPPKLNKHSSTLLSLFKSSHNGNADMSPLKPAVQSPRQELSVSSPTTMTSTQQPVIAKDGNRKMTSSTSSPLAPSLIGPGESAPKSLSQQETLLNLFRQSNTKPSPSLIPPDIPIELSAHGSPTHSRISTDIHRGKKKPKEHGLEITEIRNRFPGKTTTSATVTGPLNEPQFEKILRKPQAKQAPHATMPEHSTEVHQSQQQQFRILSRPLSTNEEDQRTLNSPRKHQYKSSEPPAGSNPQTKKSGASFKPQILKRSDPLPPLVNTPPHSKPPSNPALTTLVSTESLDDRDVSEGKEQPQEQKSALLALFGKSKEPRKSPQLARTGSVVSPLSEKPSAESELPSPLGLGRSRFGSLQEGVTGSGLDSSKVSSATAGDKKFLLGFLDGVVKKGA